MGGSWAGLPASMRNDDLVWFSSLFSLLMERQIVHSKKNNNAHVRTKVAEPQPCSLERHRGHCYSGTEPSPLNETAPLSSNQLLLSGRFIQYCYSFWCYQKSLEKMFSIKCIIISLLYIKINLKINSVIIPRKPIHLLLLGCRKTKSWYLIQNWGI